MKRKPNLTLPESALVPAPVQTIPDVVLENLAKATLKFLSRYDFLTLWDRANGDRTDAIRPDAYEFDAAESTALRKTQIEAMLRAGILGEFVRVWSNLRPSPPKEERNAILQYCVFAEVDFLNLDNIDRAEKQAALEQWEAFLDEEDFYRLLRYRFPCVCCIVGEARTQKMGLEKLIFFSGTGCLVAPDVVLTNWHVIEHLLDERGEARGGTEQEFAVFFDHRQKEVITGHSKNWPNAKRVLPAKDWFLGGSSKSVDISDFPNALDFALIQLATPIGQAARNGRYGEPRGWIPLLEASAKSVKLDQALICPQHPGGLGRSFSFGRAIGDYDGATSRLAYSLSGQRGSSGAPVFSVEGELIALHEADGKGANPRGPLHGVKHNRGILWTAFGPKAVQYLLGKQGQSVGSGAITGLWLVRTPGQPRHPLVGRQIFVDWIEDQTAKEPAMPPIHVITGGEKSGKSFSIDILRTRLETLSDTVLAFAPTTRGVEAQGSASRSYLLLPERPDVLLAEIAKALDLDPTTIPAPPPEFQWRATDAGLGVAEDLKLNDWASNSLTDWLNKEITRKGIDPERRLWIILDIPPGTPFGPGMQSFLKTAAAWTLSKKNFRLFRWIYIGYDPIFLNQITGTPERLKPHDDITKDDVRAFFHKMYAAAGKVPPRDREITEHFDIFTVLRKNPDIDYWKTASSVLLLKIERHLESVEA